MESCATPPLRPRRSAPTPKRHWTGSRTRATTPYLGEGGGWGAGRPRLRSPRAEPTPPDQRRHKSVHAQSGAHGSPRAEPSQGRWKPLPNLFPPNFSQLLPLWGEGAAARRGRRARDFSRCGGRGRRRGGGEGQVKLGGHLITLAHRAQGRGGGGGLGKFKNHSPERTQSADGHHERKPAERTARDTPSDPCHKDQHPAVLLSSSSPQQRQPRPRWAAGRRLLRHPRLLLSAPPRIDRSAARFLLLRRFRYIGR
jgi:hypothetical protein